LPSRICREALRSKWTNSLRINNLTRNIVYFFSPVIQTRRGNTKHDRPTLLNCAVFKRQKLT
jgi:hypothetical protein